LVKRFRCLFLGLLAALALLVVTGCGGNGNTLTADETSDPTYQQAQSFKNQGHNSEALAAFLKVIDRRGEGGAPESHLEAGILYRQWAKDPVEAYHHFSKYLELQPTGPRAEMVRGQRDAAKRDISRLLMAPSSDAMVQMQSSEEIDQLKRRIQELEAENQTLRGGGTGMVAAAKGAPPMITLPDDRPASTPTNDGAPDSPITPAPSAANRAAPTSSLFSPPSPSPSSSRTAQSVTAQRSTTTSARSTTPQRPAATPQRPGAATNGRSHTVGPKETLWVIARKYYGQKATTAQMQAIFEANRNVMRTETDLHPGVVLRIP
jgi:nucleoid-associated protein YgaU